MLPFVGALMGTDVISVLGNMVMLGPRSRRTGQPGATPATLDPTRRWIDLVRLEASSWPAMFILSQPLL